ncbi:MAG: glycosyltransferase family 2 protein [Planctomycetota bacterium]
MNADIPMQIAKPQFGSNSFVAGIVNYRTYEDVVRCVEALKRGSLVPDRIVIADNASVPEQAERLVGMVGSENLLASPTNRGYAGGANAIIRAAPEARYILVLNPDVYVGRDFCRELVEVADRLPQVGVVGGRLVRPESGGVDSAGIVVRRTGRCLDRSAVTFPEERFDQTGEVFAVCGAAMLLRREALEDIRIEEEYFDEDFLIYHEDVDLCWRMRLRGWRVLYAADAVAFHRRGFGIDRPRSAVSRFVRRHAYRNHYLRLVKNLLPAQLWRDGLYLAAWEFVRAGFVLLREPFLLLAWRDLLRLLPRALRKRRVIMSRKRVGYREMVRWFL